ncbi:peptide ABC transporter substrate-binding protein [Chloroflexota bacterium]
MKYTSFLYKVSSRIILLMLFLVVLASVATACLGSKTSPSPTPSPTTQSIGQGTLNLADTGPITLDPAGAVESSSAMYIFQIFSGLVRLNENLQIAPDIAQNWDESADGTVFTFHLRHDATFQNGKPVKASDFKYSWERALNPANGSLTARTYLNDIVGASDILSGKTTQLSGVRVLDDYTIEVTIDAPKAYFLNKMAYPTAFVVDRENVQSGSSWWQQPNGTGPFKLKQWQKDQILVLERNDRYYGDKAHVNEVAFHLFSGNPLQLYQEGTIDVSFVGAAYIGMVTDPSNPVSKELNTYPELSISYIGFNASVPPFDDVKIRQAFCYAVDKVRLIKLTTQNVVTPAYGILPPGMPGYNENLQGLRFNPEKAKQLIAASKYGDVSQLPPIVLTTSGWGGDISGIIGGAIEDWRRNLGIEVTVRQLEPEIIFYVLKQEKDQLYDLGWIADYPDPQNFLDILFHSGAQNNYSEYSNPQLDSFLDKAAVEQDPNVRFNMYQNAEQIIVEDAAVLPLFFSRSYVLIKPYVKGYMLSPLGYPFLNEVSIQK